MDTNHSEKLLHLLKQLVDQAGRQSTAIDTLAEKARAGFQPDQDLKRFRVWSERDQLAWELFRAEFDTVPVGLLDVTTWSVPGWTNGEGSQEDMTKRIDGAYKLADLFLSRKRGQ